jgi:hypothetical protein
MYSFMLGCFSFGNELNGEPASGDGRLRCGAEKNREAVEVLLVDAKPRDSAFRLIA